jgi:hypothetical protein
MHLVRKDERQIVFRLNPREGAVLREVLQRYPLVPSEYPKLVRRAPAAADLERQKLLDEAMAEQRAVLKERVKAMLDDPACFRRTDRGTQWNLPREHIEWMLQVLNDIRVGGWILLGAPGEARLRAVPHNEQTVPLLTAMEVCAVFQSILLESL